MRFMFTALLAAFLLTACSLDQLSQDSSEYTEQTAAPIGQLGELSRPLGYELDLTVDPSLDNFFGTVRLTFQLNSHSDHIWIHGNNLNVTSIYVEAAEQQIAATYEQVLESGVSKIAFDRELRAGDYTAVIEYSAPFDLNLSGLFKVTEQGDTYALAKSESIQARKFLPGYDEPGLKAPFKVTLTVPAEHHAITNTPEVSTTALDNGYKRIVFAETPAMPTYLLSLSVGPFDRVVGPTIPESEFRDREVPLVGYARRGRGHELQYILDITPRFVEIFETELQSAYPFRKLDIVAAPAWPSGATELSAAITYRESRILLGENPAPQARLGLLSIHAHEIAHMWFGNLVTPPWWDDLWLKEGFSSWMEAIVMDEFEPQAGHAIGNTVDGLRAMGLDSLNSARAIREPIDRNEDIRNAYDAITYSKSTGVIHMMDQYFGSELFRPALGQYVADFAEGEANSIEFYDSIARLTEEPRLISAFRSFVEQPGLPYLGVDFDCEDNKVSVNLEQSRYAPVGSQIDTEATTWQIPVCFITDSGDSHCDILTQKTATWELEGSCPSWIMPNQNGAGYFRWHASADNWASIIADFANFNDAEQMSIVDSAFAAFNRGSLGGASLRTIVEKTSTANNRRVITLPLGQIAYLNDRYLDGEDRERVSTWMSQTYEQSLLNWAQRTDEDAQILRNSIRSRLALSFDDSIVLSEYAELAASFTGFSGRSVNSEALSTDEYQTALVSAIEVFGTDFADHLWAFADEFDDSRFRAAAIDALSGVDAPSYLTKQQAFILDANTESREAYSMLFGAVAAEQTGEEQWLFAQETFPDITRRVPAQWRRNLPRLGSGFCDEQTQSELNALFEEHGALTPGFERALAQTNEQISLCIAGKDRAARFMRAFD